MTLSSIFRSIVSMTDNTGRLLNKYSYDPFGRVTIRKEQETNDYLFVGQWGVRKLKGMSDVYQMRSRLYHAEYGRFLSPDTYGFSGKSTNLYSYMGNNPLAGECLVLCIHL